MMPTSADISKTASAAFYTKFQFVEEHKKFREFFACAQMVRGIRSVSWDKEDSGAASLQNTRQLTGGFFVFCVLFHLPRPSDSFVSEDAGIEPWAVAILGQAVRRYNNSARSHPLGYISSTWPDLIHLGQISSTLLDLIHTRLDIIHLARSHPPRLDTIHLRQILNTSARSHPHSARSHPPQLDLIHSTRSHPHRLDLSHLGQILSTRPDIIHLGQISSPLARSYPLGQISSTSARSHPPRLDLIHSA